MSDTHTSVVGPVPGTGDNSREHVEEVIAAINHHDAAAFAAFYRPDAVLYTTASPEPLRGRSAIQQEAQQWVTAMPDMVLQIEQVYVDGPVAAMQLLFVGTHTGPLASPAGEIPPTGRRVSNPMAVFSRLDDDGLIVDEHRYVDMMNMAQQLGIA